MAYRYRDTKTGHFVKRNKWEKSKFSEGGRYKRETTKKLLPEPDDLLPLPEDEMIIDGTELLPTIEDIDQWIAAHEAADGYYTEDYEGGIDTGDEE